MFIRVYLRLIRFAVSCYSATLLCEARYAGRSKEQRFAASLLRRSRCIGCEGWKHEL